MAQHYPVGIYLIAVLPNPYGNDIKALEGLEWELKSRCPSIEKFGRPWYGLSPEDGKFIPVDPPEGYEGSWTWSRDEIGWEEGYLGWDLDAGYSIRFRFLPKICYISYPDKIGLEDPELRQRHLEVTRQACRVLGVTEFLIICDSCAENSHIYYEFPTKDFDHQKRWLQENLGPPQTDLAHMRVEHEEYYEIVGYYWERLEEV